MKKSTALFYRVLSFILTLLLLLCSNTMLIHAQTTAVQNAKKLLAALPDHTAIIDSNSEEYSAALDAAVNTIYALAECTEEEMLAITDYTKAFDAAVYLLLLPATENVPTEIPNAATVMDQITWLYEANEQLEHISSSDIYIFISYTKEVPHPDYPEELTTTGHLAYSEVYHGFMDVAIRVNAYITTLPEEEQLTLEEQINELFGETDTQTEADYFAQEVAQFPDHFTEENIFDYAYDFHYVNMYMDHGYYDTTQVYPEDLQKYITLEEEYQVIMGVYKEYLLDQLEAEIDKICDIEKVQTYSPLKMDLVEQAICNELSEKISAMQYVYNYTLTDKIANYDQYVKYVNLVRGFDYDDGYDDYYVYGDINGDFEIDALDALVALQAAVETKELTDLQLLAGNVDGNDVINAVDALYILQHAVDIIWTFPVQHMI